MNQHEEAQGRKAIGPNGIPNELLKLGGIHTARLFRGLLAHIFSAEYVPIGWRGGGLSVLWKGKGATSDCNNSKGLLISDHSSKVFTGLLKNNIDDTYKDWVGVTQNGCVKERGTTSATHFIRTAVDYAAIHRKSCFVLFLDLVKAFDFVFRELLIFVFISVWIIFR